MAVVKKLPKRLDLRFYAGDDFVQTINIEDSSQEDVDVSGRSYRAQVRREPRSTEVLESFTITTDDAVNGNIELSLTHEQTTDLAVDSRHVRHLVWDLEQTDESGLKRTLFAGKLKIRDDVTR